MSPLLPHLMVSLYVLDDFLCANDTRGSTLSESASCSLLSKKRLNAQ